MSERLNVSQFAKREGCDEKQVRRALEKGLLRKGDDGLIDSALAGSGWRKVNRRTLAKDSDNRPDNSKVSEVVRTPEVRPTVREDERPEQAARRFVEELGVPTNDLGEAIRIKENFLALLRQLEYEQKSGALVDLSTAETVLFEAFRAQRDAWLNWPARVGPLLAAEMGVDEADRVTEFLTAHVHKQIADLGEPDAEFADRQG